MKLISIHKIGWRYKILQYIINRNYSLTCRKIIIKICSFFKILLYISNNILLQRTKHFEKVTLTPYQTITKSFEKNINIFKKVITHDLCFMKLTN